MHNNKSVSQVQSFPKIKDSVSLGVIGGLLGTLSMDLFNVFNWKGKKSEVLYGHLAGSMLMRGYRTNKRGNFLFGQAVHLFSGVLAGIPLVYLLKATGKDHQLVKGATYGSLIWFVYYVLGIKTQMFASQPKLNRTHQSSLWHNLLFGMTAAKSIVSLAHPSVFPNQGGIYQKTANHNGMKSAASYKNWGLPYYSDYDTERPLH